jgi:glucose/arabinose dehydrogenase/azurin/lysophospholipase L1-like esterase/HEAT repeat protein
MNLQNMKQALLLFLACVAMVRATAADRLELRKDDRICIIGNTFADRMQHSGWLESLIYTKFPKDNLVFRNLGFSGDELNVRLRSEGFGSPDDWLKKEQADVIFAFFGYDESFKGPDGLAAFRKDLEKFITDTRNQNYSGKGAPRLVLFSPIAAEKHLDPNFPDPASINANLKLYTDAMGEVAKASGVPFVNLFTVSQNAYAQVKQPLTINGVHLTDEGYRMVAPQMFKALFGEAAPSARERGSFEDLRNAVNAKNAVWFSRYRTVDGYNVYGGRSFLKFDGVMNRDTMQREMEMRDVMTANRDKRVWAVAQGVDLKVEDNNLPPPVEVKSNKPGPNPDGSHEFLSGEAAINHMKVPPGCKVNLFASEEQFPELANPVQMAFDTRGRLWVAAWPNYPERRPESTKGDPLLVFEDTNGDGKADKCTTFIGDLNCPTGFQFYKDGVILVQAPDVWFIRDTDGDGKADWRERILNGMDSADSHHTANSLVLDPGGAIYLSDGVFHRTQVETPWGPPVRNTDAAIYRFEPRSSKFDRYIAYGFANPHGRVFDYWGNDLVTDATGNNTYFGPAFSGHIDYPEKHPGLKEFWERPSRPCPGTGILSSRHFPEEFQGNFLNCNVIGFLGIFRVKVREEGSGLWGETIEPPLVQSDDPNFRPTGVDVAPDGSVYFIDWQNPIIGHMQHHLRDPSRDHQHGRVYRITYEGRPLLKSARIAGERIEKLLDLLKEPENNVRTRAKIELGARDTKQVVAAAQKWTRQFNPEKVEDQHALLEALWVHQWHNVVNEPLLRQLLKSSDPRARAQAVRVLCYWRDRVREPLALLRAAANDESPRVRLEAVRALSFFNGREALATAHEILRYDTDYYLDYLFKETLRQLQKGSKEIFLPQDPQVLARTLDRLSDKELMQAPDVEAVVNERLNRKGIDLNSRSKALDQLAKLHQTDRVSEAVTALRRLDSASSAPAAAADLGLLLTATPASDLAKSRAALSNLAESARQTPVRRAAYAALVAADGKPDAVWEATARNPETRAALIDSIILLADPAFRTGFEPLLTAALADTSTPGNVRGAALGALPLMGPDNAGKNFEILAAHLRDGRDLTAAARAVTQLPREAWNKELAAPVAESILAWARTVPAAKRTEQDYIETVQVGTEMASLLPAAQSTRIRRELLDLSVRVFVIKSVREQMRYDTTRLVVEAGKPFEIIFENLDMMPHNIVFVQPGAREEVGTQAQTMSPKPDRQGRLYVPNNRKIVAASKLIEPGQKETLKLTAPEKPGDYDYVCTYPEHWKVMFGQLIVVKDAEEILKASAQPPAPQSQASIDKHQHQH